SGAEFSTIDFSTIEIAQLAADKGDNFVTVSNDSALVQNVMGGPGADTIIVSDSITPVRLFGEAGLDTFLIDSDNFGPNAVAVVPVSDDTQQFTIGIASTLFLADGITLTAFRENMAGALSFGHRSTYIAFAGTMPLPLSSARAVTNAGYNGGDWNGTVLAFSSDYSASSAAGDGIGYARATDLAISEYNGVSLGANDVIFTQTLYGDTDLNHTVNFADLLTVAQNYDLGSKFWFHGDFDYNQLVSFPDLLRIAQNYGMSSGTRSARGGMTDTILRQSENISIV
ncbi:MAG TPA: hypothetical protein PK402_02120, partial [Tepidisphaeraceae bacterium]|nr:hypothetical protein [Tepidisphaeraceae bacterium]